MRCQETVTIQPHRWNNIHALIKQECDIDLPLSTLSDYLSRWELTVQRPIKRARKQNKEEIDRWLNEEYPQICQRAQEEGAVILFGDETNIQNVANNPKGYAPKGKTPVVHVEARKFKINMLSAITKKGKLRFVLYKDNMNADKLLDFLKRLITSSNKKVFFILDNLRVHHARKVMEWLEKHRSEIEVFYLPPYAPEYNPDELVNSDLKRSISQRPSPRDEKELEHNVRSHMKTLQLNKKKVSSFFQAPNTKYAG